MIYFNVDIKFAQLIFNAVFGKKIFALGLFIYPAAKCRRKKNAPVKLMRLMIKILLFRDEEFYYVSVLQCYGIH